MKEIGQDMELTQMMSIATAAVKYPKILITPEAAKTLAEIALEHPHIETACGVAGLIMNGGKSIAITHIIPPSVMDIVRHVATVQFGGERLADAAEWLMVNYRLINHGSSAEFIYLGKAHSHHGLLFRQFSSTDEASILESVQKFGLKINVWPLLMIDENDSKIQAKGQGFGVIKVKVKTTVSIKIYFLNKEMVDNGIIKPVLITPDVVDLKTLPKLPNLAWRWSDEENFERQIRQLKEYGANVTVLHRNLDNDPEQEIQFLIQKSEWKGVLIITTDWDYPRTSPTVKVAGKSGVRLVEKDIKGEPLWTPDTDFVEVVLQLVAMKEL